MTSEKITCLYLIFVITLFSSCGTEKKDWEEAQSVDTIEAYENFKAVHPEGAYSASADKKIVELRFLEYARSVDTIPAYVTFLDDYPQSPYAEDVKSAMEPLYRKRHPDLIHARTVRVRVVLDLGGVTEPPFIIEEIVWRLLKLGGLEMKAEDSDGSDVQIDIEVKGEAISTDYMNIGSQYSGASVTGAFSLRTSNGFTYEETFDGTADPPGLLSSKLNAKKDELPHPTPASAPWRRAFVSVSGSFCDTFFGMIHDLLGKDVLIAALGDRDADVAEIARKKLIEINDPSFVPQLINILEKEDESSRSACNAMHILAEMKEPRAFELLVQRLRADNPSGPYLRRMSRGMCKDTEMRKSAAEALGDYGDPRAVEPLIDALHSYQFTVQQAAAESLKKISGEDFGRDAGKWRMWWQERASSIEIR